MIELFEDRYGKSRVRVLKVLRDGPLHELRDWTVEVLLRGNFAAAYSEGDNSSLLPTDTMKNTVYSLARSSCATTIEEFAMELAAFFLRRNPELRAVEVSLESGLWKRLSLDGEDHPSAFMHGSGELATTSVVAAQGEAPVVRSGFRNQVLLKTADSGFEGFRKDDLTTLPEIADRLLGTAVRASWVYRHAELDWDAVRGRIRETMLRTFATHKSRSVQHTLHAMGSAALETAPEIESIDLQMPNRHANLVDLSRFGQDNPNQIFVPTDEPHGYIEARLRRGDTGR